MKVRLVVLPALALGGFALTGVAVARFNQPPKTGPEPAAPAPILFGERVAGTALVEPASETILVGTPVGGIVTSILVAEGEGERRCSTGPRGSTGWSGHRSCPWSRCR